MAKLKATGGLEVQLESSSEGYRELPVDVGGLEDRTLERCTGVDEETDGGRRTILNGLQLSLKGHKQAFVAYTYALTPMMNSPVRVDWKTLTAEGVECQHIRYHQLQKGDNLLTLTDKYRKAHAVAIILVNSENNFQMAPEFTEETVKALKKGNFPVILITSEDGRNLREFINRHDPGELNVRILSKHAAHVELPTQQVVSDASYSPPTPLKTGFRSRHGIRASLRQRSMRKHTINLKEEIKQLIFPPSGPLCVSEDEGLFQVVMSTFFQHEQMVQREGHRGDGAVFRKLTKHLDEMFTRDFPFYLLIAYRVHKKQQLYECDELSPFIHNCIEKFEKLEQVSITKTLETFLRLENFKIMFDANSTPPPVFQLLEEACIELMKTSFMIKSQENSHLPPRYAYYRMLWITVASKCHVERGAREPIDYWKEYLTVTQKLLYLNAETIQDIKKGVEFGRLLQLPDEVAFTSQHMADILVPGDFVRPFNQIREFVLVLEPYVQLEEDFVYNFMSRPRCSYETCFQRTGEDRLRPLQPEGNLLVVLQEGLGFLDIVLEICRKRHWRSPSMDDEMKEWLSLLLQLIDITSEKAESYLKDFLTTKSGGITKQYQEHIKRDVICKVEDSFSQLTVEQFLQLYKAFLIWPIFVVEGYLRQYKIPAGVKICSQIWNEFFAEFVERFTDAQHHKFLLEFLKSVAACYLEQARAGDFIMHLLQLDVPKLFVTETEGSTYALQSDILAVGVPDEFTDFLSDYIQRNNLTDAILAKVETVWEAVSENNEFQQLILEVLQQELIPESLALHGTLSEPVHFIIKECVTTICQEIGCLKNPSSRLNFCWGIVASCCKKIPISDNFEWATSYYSVISQFGRIFGIYCTTAGLEEREGILREDHFPSDVADCPSENVRKFFSWVSKAQQVLCAWQQKFNSKCINFDEILLYAKSFSQINRVATVFQAESLVVDTHDVQLIKQDFLQSFELLNILLLCYIKGQPDAGWCGLQYLLAKYGVGIPAYIFLPITQHVIFPGESKSEAKASIILESHLPASVSQNFRPGLDISLQITRELTLKDLKVLLQDLDTFLTPIHKHLKMFAFFFLKECEMFDKYVKLQLSKVESLKPVQEIHLPTFTLPPVIVDGREGQDICQGVSVESLAAALQNTTDLLLKLIQGTAAYTDIIAAGSLDLRSIDIDCEFEILENYAAFAEINISDGEGRKGVKAMLQLFQFTSHIEAIHRVCSQYQLEKCLEDPELQELVELVKKLKVGENRAKLTPKDAIESMRKVSKSLCLQEGQNPKYLDLFSAVANSAVLHQFIVTEKQFVGESGQALFRQQYQLITTQLQHEEYNEAVLNDLFAAFKFMIPFVDQEQSFHSLMHQVTTLNVYDASRQLDTVNRNINLIRLWFSRAEGDTFQGVANELDCVLKTGYYQFLFSSSSEGVAGTIELYYQPVAMGYQDVVVQPGEIVQQKWNDEQINDFVRKLGFLDVEGAVGDQINQFLCLNQTAKKLLDLYTKLRELGHPEFLHNTLGQVLSCTVTQEEADRKVYVAGETLSRWEKEVTQLRSRYEQLLFFTIPKLLHLYHMITADEPDIEGVVQEVGFLFQNQPHVRQKLRKSVQELLDTRRERSLSGNFDNTPMQTVGSFLGHLFKNLELSSHSLKRRRQPSPLPRSVSTQSTHILHSCQGYTQSALLRLIITIYGGVPEAFEVFHCRPTTTEEDLCLFLNPKRATKRPFQYLILEVDRLPYELQEMALKAIKEMFVSSLMLKGPQDASSPTQIGRIHQFMLVNLYLKVISPPKSYNQFLFGLWSYLKWEEKRLSVLALLRLHFELKQKQNEDHEVPCVHFIETGPSMLEEMPWILHRDYKGVEPSLDFGDAAMTCKKSALNPDDFSCVQLVYGNAGDGKTHYIESQLKHCPHHLKITLNEAFTPLSAIKKLLTLPSDIKGCAVFFNFTMLPPGASVDEMERKHYEQLIETIGWFFFDLFILGYVEDPVTGYSFRFPGGMGWTIYIEVASRNQMNPEESLGEFFEEVPALGLLGTPHCIYPETPFIITEEVQLVCKYLRAHRIGGTRGIDRLYRESSGFPGRRSRSGVRVKFSLDLDLSEADCHKLLEHYTPKHMKKNKTTRKLFVKYMKRRCTFLDDCPAFNFNGGSTEYMEREGGQKRKNDTSQLGSTLMDTMLKEVSDFCDPIIREDWSLKPHHQLIYDFKDGGGTFGLMSLHPDQIHQEDKERFRKIGVEIPSMIELYSREQLDSYISRALNVPLDKNGHLSPVDDSAYVLTLDFAVKMLNIHERAECRVPVIIEGETGVGKTALVEMLSKLWNYSLVKSWTLQKERLLEYINKRVGDIPPSSLEGYQGCVEAIAALSAGEPVKEDDLILIGELPDDSVASGQFYTVLREELLKLLEDPVLSLIELRDEDREAGMKFSTLFAAAQFKNNPKDTAKLLYAFMNAKVKSTFHKLNVHAALQPADIVAFFEPVFKQARELSNAYGDSETSKVPFVTVFLDEVNTSSCLGLFKEVIIDRTLDGQPIPSNIFIIGACNPHRGNSLAAYDTWIRGSYYVRQLHPTLQCLMWDYGALGEQQERDYIHAKMKMFNNHSSNAHLANLTELIVMSQNLIRLYALKQLKKCELSEQEASSRSRSCVSQRDIQRVFTFYDWLQKMYEKFKPHGEHYDYNAQAVIVALGLVYYLRLDDEHRKSYKAVLDKETAFYNVCFSKSFQKELDWYIDHVDLPEGIAKTQALKENLFATIICTMTHTPLIIVGCPGSSKTLSFNLALANLKGQESKVHVFRDTTIFRSLDPQFYQCSRRTTSNELQTVFSRAINRQRNHQKVPLPVYCVVFMDEAGLPEERHESLKVLHYYLDKQEVSFVAISNHILDAAKANRAVSLYRPEASREDLESLAKGCLCSNPNNPPPELKRDVEIVANFCPAYEAVMNKKQFRQFFGLRDFIHFISYLRRKRLQMLSPQLVMEALERNFNGVEAKQFKGICKAFLRIMKSSPSEVENRNILDILHSSLSEQSSNSDAENEMRYKLIIDPSEDGSLVRLLFSAGVLQREKTRLYVYSDFPGDAQLQKINTIAAIRHSATEGHTIVMCQTDAIHESFYDLFNRRFHRIDANTGPRYYANIAIGPHIKPCRVHPNFQCIVVVKKSELENIPPPFLNRFEKYYLSHEQVLGAAFSQLPPCLTKVLQTAQKKAKEFLEHIGCSSSIYGLQKDTLNSLLLTILPPSGHQYEERYKTDLVEAGVSIKHFLLELLLQTLRENAGFRIPTLSSEEQKLDAEEVFSHVLCDSEFAGHMSQLTPEDAQQAVSEAMHALYRALAPTGREVSMKLSVNACLVVTVLTQWLTRLFCKRLLQLMTSEALCMLHRKIPSSFIQHYLNHQHHFSLKALLEAQCALLDSPKRPSSVTKLLCFTRSSQLLHQLPTQYPATMGLSAQSAADSDNLLKELVFENLQQLVVHKSSTVTSYTSTNELVKSFMASEVQRVLLFIVNMQETSKEVVNHLRIMIEEAESRNPDSNKLFTLLLHFPASRVSNPCYPSMFLQGWDFHYLDIIGYSPKGGILDIRDWFRQCYFSRTQGLPPQDDSVTLQLNTLLRDSIPFVSSRVFFGSHKQSSFNKPMGLPERNNALEDLFFKKGVGDILCERFRSYWQPSVMVQYLEKAAAFAHRHENTLNVVDSLQSMFKNLFFDFLVHMVSRINDGMNIDVIFNQGCTPTAHMLFLDLLRIFPVPKLSELKMLRIVNDASPRDSSEEPFVSPKFPFFNLVAGAVEKLVDQSRREKNQQVDMLSEQSIHLSLFQSVTQSRVHTMTDLQKRVQTRLEEVSQSGEGSTLAVAIHSLLENDDLWQKYLEDFTYHKLHLDFSNTGLSYKILQAAFGKLEEQGALQRLATLHVYVHVHKLNLAKVASLLRPLDRIEVAASILPSLSEKVQSPAESFLHDVEHSGDFLSKPEALSVFIIETLFSAVAGTGKRYGTGDTSSATEVESETVDETFEHLKLWYKVYRDVMSMPTLREHIYCRRSQKAEAQHNIMHTLFLVLRSNPTVSCDDDLRLSLTIFNQLFNKYFWSSQELRGETPRLSDVAAVAIETLTGSKFSFSLTVENPQVRHVFEGLLEHFFSEHLRTYDPADIRWFLETANQQTYWQATYLMDEVIGVEYSDDLISKADLTPGSPTTSVKEGPVHRLDGCVPMSVFKFYLFRILVKSKMADNTREDDPISSVLFFFQKCSVHSIIVEVLCMTEGLGDPGPYIPTFYQFCGPIKQCATAENQLMQQPLAHLYFLVVFENLLYSDYNLSGLIRTVQSIEKHCEGGSISDNERVLLFIEKQAAVQAVIKELAQHLDPKKDAKINVVSNLLSDLNAVLDDESMGGGNIGGHGLVLSMHMLKELHSFRTFTSLLTEQYNLLCDSINCLRPFHATLIKAPLPPWVEQPVTPYVDMGQEFQALYQRIATAMANVNYSHGSSAKVKELIRIADECSNGQLTIVNPSGESFAMDKSCCFKMVLWLSTYNDFFNKKKPSQTLARVIGMNLNSHLEPYCVQLLCCFLDPELMARRGTPTSSTSPQTLDPIYSLFVASSSGREDSSVVDLRNALVHMIAVVLGCPSQSNHLWYHMFAPEELTSTHITGFMYNTVVGSATQFYDQGVVLTEDGLYAQHSYLEHVTRGTLSLHSLYLLLWANFAAFSVALLTQHDAEQKLTGKIFSDSLSLRQHCASQLQKMWMHIQKGLAISNDERAVLVHGCFKQFFELHVKTPGILSGKLQTPEQLDRYEANWHCEIFMPCWISLKDDFAQSCPLIKNNIFEDIRQLDGRYPWFPTETTLTQSILSLADISEPSTNNLYPLSRFVVEYPQLRIGGDLLHGVLELYQWLHTELPYAVSYDEARSITLQRLVKVVAKHLSGNQKAHYEKLKIAFNDYVHLTGTRNNRLVTIGDDTPLLHLLSYSDDREQGNDLLYRIIIDVIQFHNEFLQTLLDSTKSPLCARYFPEEVPNVHLMEFTQHYHLVGRSKSSQAPTDLLQLIHSRNYLPYAFPTDPRKRPTSAACHSNLPGQMIGLIDLSKLQDDILRTCIAGKPLIEDSSISSLRIPFNFKEDVSLGAFQLGLRDYLKGVSQILPESFKKSQLEDSYRKQIEYEFHSAGYHAIMEVVTGLRTVMGHLIKEVTAEGHALTERCRQLPRQTLPLYLIYLYEYDPHDESRDVFIEIGIHSLTQSQHSCLESLCLSNLYNVLMLFVQWAEEGWYDFCTLPFAAKMQMSLPDEDALQQIPANYKGSPGELFKELKSLVDVLVHLQPSVIKAITTNHQQPIMKYLRDLQILSSQEKLISMIPDTIRLEHYVSLRLSLRRLIADVKKCVSHSDLRTPEPRETKWDDFIPDLWDSQLPHFRHRGYVYSKGSPSPDIKHRGLGTAQEGVGTSSGILNELIHYSSETNLLELSDEQEVPSVESTVSTPELTPLKQPPQQLIPERVLQSKRSLLVQLTSQVEEDLQQKASHISVEDVVRFLQSIKLDQYAATFKEYEINGELLVQFQDNELEEEPLKITSALHRLKIRLCFRRFVLGAQETAERYPASWVSQILEESNQLKQFSNSFLENEIDGELLLNASNDVFRELGVGMSIHIHKIRTVFKSKIV